MAFVLALPARSLFAQDGRFGSDSAECVKNLSLFNEYYKMKNYTDAIGPWRWVFANCPAASKNIYIRGEVMFKTLVEKAKDSVAAGRYLDTLLMLYRQRIVHYGEEGYVNGKIGLALYDYGKGREKESFDFLKRSVDAEGNNTEPLTLFRYFQLSTEMYRQKLIEKDKMLDLYDQLIQITTFNLENRSPDSANYDKARINIEIYFEPFATCAELIEINGPRMKASPDDTALIRRIVNLFERKKCHESDLYLKAAERLYALEPNAGSAASLARLHADRGNYTKASGLFQEAIDLETSNDKKALYNLELASMNLRNLKNYSQARVYAQRALAFRPGWGSPVILIGDAYVAASSSCGDNDFKHSTVFWAAVDKYKQARSMDGSVAEEANQKIATYSKYFPKLTDGFAYDLKEGDPYTIDFCWIGESTTVRYR